MTYYLASIKGDRDVALASCSRRGLTATATQETHNSTLCRVEPTAGALETLSRWMAERREVKPGYGYPFGTCLLFTRHEDE